MNTLIKFKYLFNLFRILTVNTIKYPTEHNEIN